MIVHSHKEMDSLCSVKFRRLNICLPFCQSATKHRTWRNYWHVTKPCYIRFPEAKITLADFWISFISYQAGHLWKTDDLVCLIDQRWCRTCSVQFCSIIYFNYSSFEFCFPHILCYLFFNFVILILILFVLFGPCWFSLFCEST